MRKKRGCVRVPGSSGGVEVWHVVLGDAAVVVVVRPLEAPPLGPVVRLDLVATPRRGLHLPEGNAWEERGQLVELLALPAVPRVVVALGALDLDAEENPRHLGGGLLGAAVLGEDDRPGAMLADIPLGGDELARDLVPAGARVELLGQPINHRRGGGDGAVIHPPREDHVTPVPRPVLAVLRLVEQLADEPHPLVRRRIEEERRQPLGRRHVADDVEPYSPSEGRVVGRRGEQRVGVEQRLGKELIDLLRRLAGPRLARKNLWRRQDHRDEQGRGGSDQTTWQHRDALGLDRQSMARSTGSPIQA